MNKYVSILFIIFSILLNELNAQESSLQRFEVILSNDKVRQLLLLTTGENEIAILNLKKSEQYVIFLNHDDLWESCDLNYELNNGNEIIDAKNNSLKFKANSENVTLKVSTNCTLNYQTNLALYISVARIKVMPNPHESTSNKTGGPLTAHDGFLTESLIKNIFLNNSCVEITNIKLIGQSTQIGYFENGESSIGLKSGMILSNGDVQNANGPNVGNGTGNIVGGGDDTDLLSISKSLPVFDATGIEFDFIPTVPKIYFNYVFASEEYEEYTCSIYDDVIGFFINGPGIGYNKNIALIPGTSIPVKVNTVNQGISGFNGSASNCTPPIGSLAYSGFFVSSPVGSPDIEFDGYTTIFTAEQSVIPCSTYHMKLVIGDVSDGLLDSAVFFEENSFVSSGNFYATVEGKSEVTVSEAIKSDVQIKFARSNPKDLILGQLVKFTLDPSSTAIPGLDFVASAVNSILIPAGEEYAYLSIKILKDKIFEPTETIIFNILESCTCSENITISIINEPYTPNDGKVCDSAEFFCDLEELNGYKLKMFDFPNPTAPSPFCSSIGGAPNNSIWLKFVPGSDTVNLNIIPTNCTLVGGLSGIKAAIYSGSCDSLKEVVCQISCPANVINLNNNEFIPGNEYWIVLDGCNGSVCDIQFELLSGTSFIPKDSLGEIISQDSVCLNSLVNFYIKPSKVYYDYKWKVDNEIIPPQTPNGTDLNYYFTSTGNKKICVNTEIDCIEGSFNLKEICKNVNVSNPNPPTLLNYAVCEGQTVNYEGKYYKPGIYNFNYNNGKLCDSLVILNINQYPKSLTNLGTIVQKCANDCITIGDKVFCDESSSQITLKLKDHNNCDSLIVFKYQRVKETKDTTLCDGDTLKLENQLVFKNGTYYQDSKVQGDTCILEVFNVSFLKEITKYIQICQGDTVFLAGFQFTETTDFITKIPNPLGCDSTIIYKIKVMPTVLKTFNYLINKGVVYNGKPIIKDTIIVEKYTTNFGCDSTVTKIFMIKTATKEFEGLEQRITAIPNPANGVIRFESILELEVLGYKIYTSSGQLVLSSNKKTKLPLTLKIDNLPTGSYWINFETNAGILTCSFIKQ